MIVRFSGGSSGIGEYLLQGRKAGREETREQLDERMVLDGDLGITDRIIKGMQTEGERYLHITLSFAEDRIPRETLQAINEEFKDFLMAAHQADEYNWYAEAHLPRIQNYRDVRTGEMVERLTHLHVVIPEINLLSGGRLCPTGLIRLNEDYLDAFQELTNQKYGLASPKDEDRRRAEAPGKNAFISRYKGDEFELPQSETRRRIVDAIVDRDIRSTDDLVEFLKTMGEVRVRKAGTAGEFLNLKVTGAAKGINLKGALYQGAFLALPKDKKLEFALGGKLERGTHVQPKRSREDLDALVQVWREIRSLEVKHIKEDKKRKSYRQYTELSPSEKREHLTKKEREFQQRHRGREPVDLEIEPTRVQDLRARADIRLDPPVQQEPAVSTAEQARVEAEREKTEKTNAFLSEWQIIKRDLDPGRLLKKVEANHGVNPTHYDVTGSTEGAPRIRAGTRNYNVADFLTKELHLSWQQASAILKETYREQTERKPIPKRALERPDLWGEFIAERKTAGKAERDTAWAAQREKEQDRRKSIGQLYRLRRQQIFQDRSIGETDRAVSLKLSQADRVKDEMNARSMTLWERAALKDSQKVPWQQLYVSFLEQKQIAIELAVQAEAYEEDEKEKLREIRKRLISLTKEIEQLKGKEEAERKLFAEQEHDGARTIHPEKPYPPNQLLKLDAKVENDRSITYSRDGEALFRDAGTRVFSFARDAVSMEAFVRLSQLKYGRELQFFGAGDFIKLSIKTAVDNGIRLELADSVQADMYQKALKDQRGIDTARAAERGSPRGGRFSP